MSREGEKRKRARTVLLLLWPSILLNMMQLLVTLLDKEAAFQELENLIDYSIDFR